MTALPGNPLPNSARRVWASTPAVDHAVRDRLGQPVPRREPLVGSGTGGCPGDDPCLLLALGVASGRRTARRRVRPGGQFSPEPADLCRRDQSAMAWTLKAAPPCRYRRTPAFPHLGTGRYPHRHHPHGHPRRARVRARQPATGRLAGDRRRGRARRRPLGRRPRPATLNRSRPALRRCVSATARIDQAADGAWIGLAVGAQHQQIFPGRRGWCCTVQIADEFEVACAAKGLQLPL